MISGLRKWEYIGTVAIFDGRAIDIYESPTSNIRLTDGNSEVTISENQLSWFIENMVTNI